MACEFLAEVIVEGLSLGLGKTKPAYGERNAPSHRWKYFVWLVSGLVACLLVCCLWCDVCCVLHGCIARYAVPVPVQEKFAFKGGQMIKHGHTKSCIILFRG